MVSIFLFIEVLLSYLYNKVELKIPRQRTSSPLPFFSHNPQHRCPRGECNLEKACASCCGQGSSRMLRDELFFSGYKSKYLGDQSLEMIGS